MSRLLKECHQRAADILSANRAKLEMIAQLLIERETLDGRDVEEILQHDRILTDEERAGLNKSEAESPAAQPAAEAPPSAATGGSAPSQ